MRRDQDPLFLGTGWSFPPSFSPAVASVDMASGEQDIRESLWILFSTSLGERLMLPQYGSQLTKLVFRNVTTTLLTELEDYVRKAILHWEPRIDVEKVSARQDDSFEGRILIALDYRVRGVNTRSNLVYPFYIREGTIAPVAP